MSASGDSIRTLGLFAKHPVAGTVKTRLADGEGPQAAADLAAAFVYDLIARCGSLGDRRRIAASPSTPESLAWFQEAARESWQVLPQSDGDPPPAPPLQGGEGKSWQVWPQPEGELGERLAAFFREHLVDGPVVVIGSDSPTLPASHIEEAFAALAQRDCVLAPAMDGGYVLIGLRRPAPELFLGIDWSTPQVLAQTVRRIAEAGQSLTLLSPWYDVDSATDLAFLAAHLEGMRMAGGHDARCTAATVARLAVGR